MRFAVVLFVLLLPGCASAVTGPPATTAQRSEYRAVADPGPCVAYAQTEMRMSLDAAHRACSCMADAVAELYTADELAAAIRFQRGREMPSDHAIALKALARVGDAPARRCGF